MITPDELNEAIAVCEADERHTYDVCIRLAALYTIRQQYYSNGSAREADSHESDPGAVGEYGDSEFLRLVSGRPVEKIVLIFDELMTTLEVINARLYDGVLRRIDRE